MMFDEEFDRDVSLPSGESHEKHHSHHYEAAGAALAVAPPDRATRTARHFLGAALLWLLLAACRPASSTFFPAATAGAAAADLPIAIGAPSATLTLPTPLPAGVIAAADAEYLLLTNLYERNAVSVVSVEARMPAVGTQPQGDLVRGSGFVLDREGHIVTNAHVVAEAAELRVTFHEGDTSAARLIGLDTFSDLAVIRVPSDGLRLRPLSIGDSDSVRVGQRAITISNPFGLNASMSVGIVSGVGRSLLSAELIDDSAPPGFQNPSIIQIDAPINPGSSGGPLLNSEGLVVGVTTAIRTDSGVFAGVGFAVPSSTLMRVVPQLIQHGRAEYPWLGITVSPEDNGYSVAGLAHTLSLPVREGVLVRGVTVGSPAEQAGLRGGAEVKTVRGQPVCVGGDIIIAVDGVPVRSMNDLSAHLIENARVGDVIMLDVIRHQQVFRVPVRLSARPAVPGLVRDCVR